MAMGNAPPDSLSTLTEQLLEYLSEHIPPPLSKLFNLIVASGSLILSQLMALAGSLASYTRWDWEPQKFLPPLIVALCAYYALVSILRTAGFMIRTTLWVAKWSIIIAVLSASANHFLSTEETVAGRVQNPQGAAGSRTTQPRTWYAFDAHRQWRDGQYNSRHARVEEAEGPMVDAQQLIWRIAGYAGRTVGEVAPEMYAYAKTLLESLADASTTNKNEQMQRTHKHAANPNDSSFQKKGRASSR